MGAIEILRKHGLKKTTPRISIIQALQASQHPVSESEIKVRMGDLYDRITFYRNVQSLIKADVIHKIVVDDRIVKYALNCVDRHKQFSSSHAHFICRSCERVICLEHLGDYNFTLPAGFKQDTCELMIKGLCDQCAIICE